MVAAPLLPRAAIRLAGLPRPVVPADEAELTDDDPPLPPAELAERADLARGYLAGLAGAAAVIAAAGALVAAFAGGWAGPVFAGVTAAVLAAARPRLRRRRARPHRAGGGYRHGHRPGRRGGGPGLAAEPGRPARLLLVGAGAGIAALDAAARGMRPEISPVLRRTVDLMEGLLVAAAVPLAFAAMDLFELVRGW